jgi:hypothetical protein
MFSFSHNKEKMIGVQYSGVGVAADKHLDPMLDGHVLHVLDKIDCPACILDHALVSCQVFARYSYFLYPF